MEERIRKEAATAAEKSITLTVRLRRKNKTAENAAPVSKRSDAGIFDPMSANSRLCVCDKAASGEKFIVLRFTRKRTPSAGESAPEEPLVLNGRLDEIEYVATAIEGAPTKRAFVYLPQGYDSAKKYPVLYLLHGVGGTETEWLMGGNGKGNCLRLLEKLKEEGALQDFIIVFPNGRTCPDFNNTRSKSANGKLVYTPNVLGFFDFDKELRYDLIPAVEAHYSVSKERKDRALAGLSMGGMQTINLGICKCLDLFGWYGAFSAGSATTTGKEAGAAIANGTYPVNGVYLCCGMEDAVSYSVHRTFTRDFSLVAGDGMARYKTELLPGLGHTFEVWDYAFAQFAQFAFAK